MESSPHSEAPAPDLLELAQSPEVLFRIFEFAPDAILLVDGRGRIVKANAQTSTMFGFQRDELVGQPVEVLIPQRYAAQHIHHRSGYLRTPRTRTMGAGLELFGRRKDGTEFPVDIMLSPLDVEQQSLVLGVVRDVTERKRFETMALAAREVHLKEVHHRVKNNLPVISSLLYLQSTHTRDPHVLELLAESRNRVNSIALIHEKLYRSQELVRLDYRAYVSDLVASLFGAYGVNGERLHARMRVGEIFLEVDTAIPLGLVVNELVSNALKHAFPDRRAGEIWVHLDAVGPREYELEVGDNGVGLPVNFDWRTSTSLGLRLVNDLTRQLEGSVAVERGAEGGTVFRVRFKELVYKERS
jgi:PAS domain S-box-containing protein